MAGWTFDAYSIAGNYLHQGLQLTVRLNCSISMGFIKQFHQLDKVARQKVSPLTIALKKKKKANRVQDIYSIYILYQCENINLLSKIVFWVVGDS